MVGTHLLVKFKRRSSSLQNQFRSVFWSVVKSNLPLFHRTPTQWPSWLNSKKSFIVRLDDGGRWVMCWQQILPNKTVNFYNTCGNKSTKLKKPPLRVGNLIGFSISISAMLWLDVVACIFSSCFHFRVTSVCRTTPPKCLRVCVCLPWNFSFHLFRARIFQVNYRERLRRIFAERVFLIGSEYFWHGNIQPKQLCSC